MNHSRAAKNDAARNVDVVGCGNEVTESMEDPRHGLTREDVAGKKDAGKNGQKRKLHGLCLRIGLAGNENAKRKRDKKIRQREQGQKKYVAMDGHTEDEAHESQDERELEESDAQVGKQFAEQQAHRPDGGDEELFERAAFLFADDGKRGEKRGDVEKQNGGETGQKEIR